MQVEESKPLISVIIVNFNGLKWLEKCLISLEEQTFKDFEVIIVDNNSTDGSVEMIEKKFKDIRLIRSSVNGGFAFGNALGVNAALGQYLLLINNDTWIQSDFLNKIYSRFLLEKVDLIAPTELSYLATQEKSGEAKNFGIDIFGHPVWGSTVKTFYVKGACLFFEKRLYIETKGLDLNFFMYFEETDWCWRLHLLNKSIKQVDDIYFHHAESGGVSGIKYNMFLWRNQNCLQMLLKNYEWFNLLWIFPIYIWQNIAEMLIFCILMKFDIASTYPKGWYFNIKNWPKIQKERSWVQQNRVSSDLEIMKRMYFGFGKIKHLVDFIKNK